LLKKHVEVGSGLSKKEIKQLCKLGLHGAYIKRVKEGLMPHARYSFSCLNSALYAALSFLCEFLKNCDPFSQAFWRKKNTVLGIKYSPDTNVHSGMGEFHFQVRH
jgi:hypothetical protein